MRILTRRIYRAFPELDRYSDEQCARFVRAARRGWVRTPFRGLVSLVAGFVAFVIGAFPVAFIGESLERSGFLANRGPVWFIAIIVPVGILFLGPAPVTGFLTRDWLLRRRIRYVLRARGVCMNCRYSLVGLPVGAGNAVACPECATECHVDPSLGELVVDETGQTRYAPSPDSIPKPIFFTPKRVRIIKRTGWVVAGLLFFGVPLLWGSYEIWLRSQASRAKAAILGPAAILALVEQNQPPGTTPKDPNAFDALARAVFIMETTDANTWRAGSPNPIKARAVYPDFSSFYYRPDASQANARPKTEEEIAYEKACGDLARQMIDVYRTDGLFTELNQVADCRRAVRPLNIPPGGLLSGYMPPDLRTLRSIARMNAGRMHLAWQNEDVAEFREALRSNLSLSRAVSHQALALDRLVGIAIESLTLGRVRAVLTQHPGSEWLEAIAATMKEQAVTTGPDLMLEGERIYGQDYLATFFSDPANARLGRWSPGLTSMLGRSFMGRLGTFDENVAGMDATYALAKQAATTEFYARDPKLTASGDTGLMLVDATLSAARLLRTEDQIALERRGTQTLLALERFRFIARRYPATLQELVPTYLDKVPIDPFSGRPLGYKTLAEPDAQGRLFLLYSTGVDKTDDGGKAPSTTSTPYNLLSLPLDRANTGFDFVLNENDR